MDTELLESVANLELALDDVGWAKLTATATQEFSHAGLLRAAEVCRVMAVANPLVRRGVNLRAAYVFGQGVEVSATTTEGQDVSAVVHQWWDDNTATLTGDTVQERLERALATDGNLLLANFTNPLTGRVQVRVIPFAEVTDKVTNPEDAAETWFYRREYTATTLNPDQFTTTTSSERRVVWYPDINHRPATRPKTINGHPVRWDAPLHHVKVNDLEGWQWGIGDVYTAVHWARSYRDFLADWATLVKSLSQIAWRTTAPGRKHADLKAALTRTPTTGPSGDDSGAGATVNLTPDVTLEAVPKSGATIDSGSGRPLAAMVAAGLDIPVTILLADPGVTGARATAETLDTPLRLAMEQRQSVWADTYRVLAGYAITQAVKAPQGGLRGTITRDRWTDREQVTLAGDTSAAVDVIFPPLDSLPIDTLMSAIKTADDTGKVPGHVILRLLLQALEVPDVDEVMGAATDDDGNLIDPAITAGALAAAAYREGRDPVPLGG